MISLHAWIVALLFFFHACLCSPLARQREQRFKNDGNLLCTTFAPLSVDAQRGRPTKKEDGRSWTTEHVPPECHVPAGAEVRVKKHKSKIVDAPNASSDSSFTIVRPISGQYRLGSARSDLHGEWEAHTQIDHATGERINMLKVIDYNSPKQGEAVRHEYQDGHQSHFPVNLNPYLTRGGAS